MTETTTSKRNWFARHKILTGLGVLFIFAVIGASADKSSPQPTIQTASTSVSASPTPTPKPSFDLAAFYNAVQSGMTKAQVIAAANGTQPSNCSESSTQDIGTMEYCSWNKDFNSVDIDFSNGTVYSKTKTGF